MDRRTKKALIRARNRRNQLIFQHARVHKAEHDRIVEEDLERRLAAKRKDREDRDEEEVVWSARTQMVRDRITGKKTMARERWNRFAGTGESGGRGL